MCALVQVLTKATTLKYEFYKDNDVSGARVSIVVPHMDKLTESEDRIMSQLVQRFDVPQQERCAFSSARL